MTKPKHTPGPWKESVGDVMAFNSPNENTSLILTGNKELSHIERKANARLAACAPDLLEACENALFVIEGDKDLWWEIELLRKVIKKARGDS